MNQEQAVKTNVASLEQCVSTRTQREDLPVLPLADPRLPWPSRGDAREKEEELMAQAPAPLPQPPAPSGPMHVVVDLNRCQAYAQCCFFAPSVFKLHGEEALWYDPAPDAALREQVLRAAAACPVQAIIVQWQNGSESQINRGAV